ncbi:tetratricopeptide repeat protein, partial [bacterium]
FSMAMMTAGLMSKPILVVTPLILLLVDFWPLGRFSQKGAKVALWAEKLPFFLLAAAFSIATLRLQGTSIVPTASLSVFDRAAYAATTLFHYLKSSFWPVSLTLSDRESVELLGPPAAWAVLALFALLLGLTCRSRNSSPHTFTGWWWFVAALLPVSGFLQVGLNSYADRFTYIPHMGLSIALVFGADSLSKRLGGGEKWPRAAMALVLAILAFLTGSYIGKWKDSRTLALYLKENGNGYFLQKLSQSSTADSYLKEGDYSAAIREYEAAISQNVMDDALWRNMGIALGESGRLDEAIRALERAVSIRPQDPENHFSLAVGYLRSGLAQAGIAELEKALSLDPIHLKSLKTLGYAQKNAGQTTLAMRYFVKYLEVSPDKVEILGELAMLQAQSGQIDGALANFGELLEISPQNPVYNFNAALAFEQKGDSASAEKHYLKTLKINPSDLPALFNYGLLLEKQGRKAEAATQFRKFLEISPLS